MTRMSHLKAERRKKEIADARRRSDLRRTMKLGLPFDTQEGRKRQKGLMEV